MALDNGRHLLHDRLDQGEELRLGRGVQLKGFRFFKGDPFRPRDDQGKMRAACGLIRGIHHLTIFNDSDARTAAAHIHHSAVLHAQKRIGSRRFIDEAGAGQARALQHVGHGPHLGQGHARRIRTGRGGQCHPQAGFHILLEASDQVHRAHKIHHHAVTHHLGELVRACHRLHASIQYHDHRVGRAQVHAHMQRTGNGARDCASHGRVRGLQDGFDRH